MNHIFFLSQVEFHIYNFRLTPHINEEEKANLNLFSFRERHTERETGEENKISGEHDNISENLRVFN